jgi:ribosomal subunit interface protein
MDIVVKGRHCEVSDRYREHVAEKLSRVEKYDHKVIRIDVMVTAERNPRQHATAVCVELTVRSRGPVVRAECCAEDKLAALDGAWAKLEERLRRASDRRRVHHGSRTPVSVARATADLPLDTLVDDEPPPESGLHLVGPLLVDGDGPLVVREKTHAAVPMTLDQALHEMELVGHDFFLFVDQHTAEPSVVYRRRGYDYGVVRLSL